jgi:hypothetical protein
VMNPEFGRRCDSEGRAIDRQPQFASGLGLHADRSARERVSLKVSHGR